MKQFNIAKPLYVFNSKTPICISDSLAISWKDRYSGTILIVRGFLRSLQTMHTENPRIYQKPMKIRNYPDYRVAISKKQFLYDLYFRSQHPHILEPTP